MTWAPGPVVTRRRLGGELKQLRERSGLKLEDVARRLECSPSKISRLENGKGIPRTRDVRDMLEAYGVADNAERERLLEWSRTGQRPMWWSKYADVLPPAMAEYIELEWDAVHIRAYESYIVHGLLQTRDYARAVLWSAWCDRLSEDQIDRLVDVRLRRQEALTSDHGLNFTCVLDESALLRVVGSPRIQRAQLEHLIALAGAEHVEVRVLPFAAGLVRPGHDPFSLLEFGGGVAETTAHVERFPSEGGLLQEQSTVENYERQWEALRTASRSEAHSIPLLERAMHQMVDA